MTYHDTDGAIVERLVGLGVEERILQDSGRETDLVGGRIVVGVDGLWGHVPLVSVDWLSGLLGDLLVVGKLAASQHILVVTLGRIDVERAVVGPLVGIAYLDIELVELLMGCALVTSLIQVCASMRSPKLICRFFTRVSIIFLELSGKNFLQ